MAKLVDARDLKSVVKPRINWVTRLVGGLKRLIRNFCNVIKPWHAGLSEVLVLD